MRPRKRLLLYCLDEAKAAVLSTVLNVHRYNVTRVCGYELLINLAGCHYYNAAVVMQATDQNLDCVNVVNELVRMHLSTPVLLITVVPVPPVSNAAATAWQKDIPGICEALHRISRTNWWKSHPARHAMAKAQMEVTA